MKDWLKNHNNKLYVQNQIQKILDKYQVQTTKKEELVNHLTELLSSKFELK